MKAGSLSLPHRIASFLFTYRSTPHAMTSRAPSELFLCQQLCTRLHLLHLQWEQKVTNQQATRKKANHDRRARQRELLPGQKVVAQNYHNGPRWIPGVVIQQLGPLTYSVQIWDSICWRRRIDQLRESSEAVNVDLPDSTPTDLYWPSVATEPSRPETVDTESSHSWPTTSSDSTDSHSSVGEPPTALDTSQGMPPSWTLLLTV